VWIQRCYYPFNKIKAGQLDAFKFILILNYMNNRKYIYLALCLIVIGFGLILSNQNNRTKVEEHKSDETTVKIIRINTDEKKNDTKLYTGIASILIGLVLAAKNLKLRNKRISEKKIFFTKREEEIVRAMKDGLSNKSIAQKLNLSPSTIKTHSNNIYKKVKVNSRAELLENLGKHGY